MTLQFTYNMHADLLMQLSQCHFLTVKNIQINIIS